jgi:outer membrane protein OmpA-like peptidoglycan-associated protein
MAGQDQHRTDGAPPTRIHIERKPVNWLAWLLLIAGILALLWALVRHRGDDAPVAAPATNGAVVATTPNVAGSAAVAGTTGLGAYLAGNEAAPRRFTLDTLKFDTAKSDLRPDDRAGVDDVAQVLARYPNTHVRIAGFADSRGSDATNVALGKARAESVKAALVAKGIDAGRIDAVSGGASNPVDTNATSAGQAENRRTELVVTQR